MKRMLAVLLICVILPFAALAQAASDPTMDALFNEAWTLMGQQKYDEALVIAQLLVEANYVSPTGITAESLYRMLQLFGGSQPEGGASLHDPDDGAQLIGPDEGAELIDVSGNPPADPDAPVPLDPLNIPGRYAEGAMNEYVLWVQAQLKTLGYFSSDSLDLTGSMGASTAGEVRQFRLDHGLSSDAVIDYDLVLTILRIQQAWGIPSVDVMVEGYYRYLPLSDGRIEHGARGQDVRWVQQCLTLMGFGSLTVDGAFGDQTLAAFQQFIRAYNSENGEPAAFQTTTTAIRLGHLRAMLEMYVARGYDLSLLGPYANMAW